MVLRGITAPDLAEGATIVAAGRSVAEITSATKCLVYQGEGNHVRHHH